MADTAPAKLDQAVDAVHQAGTRWRRVSVPDRITVLDRLLAAFGAVSSEWVELSVRAKGSRLAETVATEEWMSGPLCVLRNLRLLRQTLTDIAEVGRPRLPGRVERNAEGGFSVEVLPADPLDRFLFPGFSAEVWTEPGVERDGLTRVSAGGSSESRSVGPELVLGAGNVSSIAPTDVLYKLFVENRTAVLKTNPVLSYLTPLLVKGFSTLIDQDFLRVIDGDSRTGAHLCRHPAVGGIHVTGALSTHQAILSLVRDDSSPTPGTGQTRAGKRLTSELGNVSPVIVVPGPWTEEEIDFQAQNLATMLANNGGFNCNALRVLIQPAEWAGSERLLDTLRTRLGRIPTRLAYYPGADERFRRFLDAHPEAERFGEEDEGRLPWVLVPGLDPEARDDICFGEESFLGLAAETRIAAPSGREYLRRAVRFANETLWGTLCATLLVHPETEADAAWAADLAEAVAALRYGTVCVNHWPGVAFTMMSTPWGGFPGAGLEDPQSGIGTVHNTLMLYQPRKAVVRGPFHSSRTPPWFVTSEGNASLVARLARMHAGR